MKNPYTFLSIILLAVSLTACAIIIPPTGGPKDTKAPVVKKSIPASGTTNFKGGTVLIEFDEEIEADINPTKIIVSPPLQEGQIEIKERKKKYLEIRIPKTLQENTTYTVNFNNVVKDITEGNTVKNISFAFSTGPQLDSLAIKGKTVFIQNKQALKDILIGLYPITDSLDIRTQKPYYLIYSNEEGNFNLTHLKQGSYYLLALDDKNKNLLMNNQEKTDFISSIDLPLQTNKPLLLELSINDTTGNKLLTQKTTQQKQLLSYRNGLKHYTYAPLNTKDTLYIFQDRKKTKELNTFIQNFSHDSVSYTVSATDSLGNFTQDTLTVAKPKKDIRPEPPTLTSLTKDILPHTRQLVFLSNKPILHILKDSITINDEKITETIQSSSNGDSLLIVLTPEQQKQDTLKVRLQKSALVYYDKDSSRIANFIINKADPSNYSVFEMQIKTDEPHYLIQLLTEDYIILEEYKNIPTLTYDYISPGNYRIRAILDKNGNGHWDPADPVKNRKAEPIIYYTNNKLSLKPNWELKDLMFIF